MLVHKTNIEHPCKQVTPFTSILCNETGNMRPARNISQHIFYKSGLFDFVCSPSPILSIQNNAELHRYLKLLEGCFANRRTSLPPRKKSLTARQMQIIRLRSNVVVCKIVPRNLGAHIRMQFALNHSSHFMFVYAWACYNRISYIRVYIAVVQYLKRNQPLAPCCNFFFLSCDAYCIIYASIQSCTHKYYFPVPF